MSGDWSLGAAGCPLRLAESCLLHLPPGGERCCPAEGRVSIHTVAIFPTRTYIPMSCHVRSDSQVCIVCTWLACTGISDGGRDVSPPQALPRHYPPNPQRRPGSRNHSPANDLIAPPATMRHYLGRQAHHCATAVHRAQRLLEGWQRSWPVSNDCPSRAQQISAGSANILETVRRTL